MKSANKMIRILILTIFFAMSIPHFAQAEQTITNEVTTGMSLIDALAWGREHSTSFQKLEDQLASIESSLLNMQVSLEWQFDLKGSAIHGTLPPISRTDEDERSTQGEVTLQGKKAYLFGLSLQPKITYAERNPIDWEELDENLNFSISASQKLFPLIPNQLEQEYRQTINQQASVRESLQWQQGFEQIGWLDGYLNLIRLQERVKLALAHQSLSSDNLRRVEEEQEIGEAGKINYLQAKILLKQAESRLLQAQVNFDQQWNQWLIKLGLPTDGHVQLTTESPYLEVLQERVQVLSQQLKEEDLLGLVLENDHQLSANQRDQEWSQQQMVWLEKKGWPEVQLSGSYDYQQENWTTGLHLTYQLSQKQNRLQMQDAHRKLQTLKAEEQQLIEEAELQLQQYLNQVEISRLAVQEKELTVDKAELEYELVTQQWTTGLITERDQMQKALDLEQARIELASAQDQLFINQLRLYYYCVGNELLR